MENERRAKKTKCHEKKKTIFFITRQKQSIGNWIDVFSGSRCLKLMELILTLFFRFVLSGKAFKGFDKFCLNTLLVSVIECVPSALEWSQQQKQCLRIDRVSNIDCSQECVRSIHNIEENRQVKPSFREVEGFVILLRIPRRNLFFSVILSFILRKISHREYFCICFCVYAAFF